MATEAVTAAAHSRVWAFLARALADPDDATLSILRDERPLVAAALEVIGAAQSCAALEEFGSAIEQLDHDALAAAHRRVFGLAVSGDCPPYEGEYGQPHIFQKTQTLADNAGFIAAFGLAPAPGLADRLDHIAVELEFLHVLAAKEAYARVHGHGVERVAMVRDATRRYLNEHLGRWAPTFAARMEAKAQHGPYAALARLLAAFVAEEMRAWDIAPAAADFVPNAPQADDGVCDGCAMATTFTPAMRGQS